MPGAYDALSARIIAAHGFEALVAGGYAATGSLLGEPDLGQMTMNDYADHYGRIAQAVDIPVFADADTGFGAATNVRRMMRAFERAGLAGVFIEDQVFPKRCGYLPGKELVPVEQMLAKIGAALDARDDPAFVFVARTDALGVEGIEAAIERARLYAEAGADAVFVQGADTIAGLQRICREVPVPQIANVSQASGTSGADLSLLEAAGAAAVIFPSAALYAAAQAVEDTMAALARERSLDRVAGRLMPVERYDELVALADYQRSQERFDNDARRIKEGRH
jgi:methylisocitrate lyase